MEQTHAIATARTNEAKNELMSSDDAMPKQCRKQVQFKKTTSFLAISNRRMSDGTPKRHKPTDAPPAREERQETGRE